MGRWGDTLSGLELIQKKQGDGDEAGTLSSLYLLT